MTDAAVVAVVGSANLDIVVPVPHHPARGETVLGGDHLLVPGGKGANQAVAASRLGADVVFVGAVGADSSGETLTLSLTDAGVGTEHLHTIAETPSGIALITVDADGDNAIVVSPGANGHLNPIHVARAGTVIGAANVLLLQLETPLDTVLTAATSGAACVVLDPAPAPSSPLPEELLRAVDVIVPNETELAALTDRTVVPTTLEEIEEVARTLPVPIVIVTLGARGAMIITDETAEHVPAPSVDAIDTTAAGDAFRAALGVEMAIGRPLIDAVRFAVRVGAATTRRPGAQPSLPARDEVEGLLS
ncbi:MAG: ribokinase [Acidimicrobiales bacterium]|nr:ribokinase [Acidimicrobiales bacterium]RZV47180.1 MAG: ribokinase [Acidimicrobiales bacterium]